MSSFRAGFVALLGQPNAGKSTLLNTLVGEKVAIVTPKPQTTRRRVVGLVNRESSQIVIVDTPGIIRKPMGFNNYLRDECAEVLKDSDLILALLNIDEPSFEKLEEVLTTAAESGKEWMAVITKSDLGLDHRIHILREKLEKYGKPVITISAEKSEDDAREKLLSLIEQHLPLSKGSLYNPELYTTQTLREMVAEIIREKCFEQTHHEIPYGLAIKVISFKEEKDIDKIHAEIWLAKQGHKPILIGKEAKNLKTIGTLARHDIEQVIGKKVYLNLFVRVKEKWMKDPQSMRDLGYVCTL